MAYFLKYVHVAKKDVRASGRYSMKLSSMFIMSNLIVDNALVVSSIRIIVNRTDDRASVFSVSRNKLETGYQPKHYYEYC